MIRRVLTLVLVAGVAIAATPAPARADAAGPTNYRSTVERAPDGLSAEVVGGDSFLRVRAERGREVRVLGYEDEPWLWIRADGTVLRNERSPATYLNADRYADVEAPPIADAEADPRWEEVDDDGEWAWHDHRIHWMSPDDPPAVRDGGGGRTDVLSWEVKVEVDGRAGAITGDLEWLPGANPLPWIALAALAGVPFVLLRRRPEPALAISLVVAAGLALVAGFGELADQPADAVGTPLPIILPALALVFGLGAVTAVWRNPGLGQTLALAAVATLIPWAVTRFGVLANPVLPTTLPAGFDRAATAIVLGVVVASVGVIARGFLRATSDALAEPDGASA